VLVRPNTGVLLRAAADEPRTQQYPVVTILKRLENRMREAWSRLSGSN